jgi:AraC family transcriptional activator of pobA
MHQDDIMPILSFGRSLKPEFVKVYKIESATQVIPFLNRRGFHKICLLTGKGDIHVGNIKVAMERADLCFGNPHILTASDINPAEQNGYICFFTENFLKRPGWSEILPISHLFGKEGLPVFPLNREQKKYIITIFQKMILAQNTDYIFKDDLICNYLHLLIHEALKMLLPARLSLKQKFS